MIRNFFADSMLEGLMNDFSSNRALRPLMSTDVKEFEAGYELAIELPGFGKDDIKAELKDGYLTVSAEKKSEEENAENGKYLRRESFTGSCSRSYYVGHRVNREDIKAKFENGVLVLLVPKPQNNLSEADRYIAIEG